MGDVLALSLVIGSKAAGTRDSAARSLIGPRLHDDRPSRFRVERVGSKKLRARDPALARSSLSRCTSEQLNLVYGGLWSHR